LLVRYARWLWEVMHLNLGVSLAYRVNVSSLIGSRAVNTVILALASMILSWVLAIPIGVIVAVRQNSAIDRVLSFASFLGMSVPAFFLAFLAMDFALWSGRFPVGGSFSPDYAMLDTVSKVADRFNHLILPAVVLGLAGMASLMRLMRSQILEIRNADFVRTARAKGLPDRTVMYKHVLRNALNPFVTIAGYGLADLLGGAALVEAVMNLQGLGLLLLNAVRSLDVPLVMGSVLMGAVLLLIGNLIADIALVAVDPRVDFATLAAE
jgi:peptide/nickel transport system permease protein